MLAKIKVDNETFLNNKKTYMILFVSKRIFFAKIASKLCGVIIKNYNISSCVNRAALLLNAFNILE